MQLSCVIITLQIFWAKPGNPREGGRVERSNEWGGRSREGEARAKPGNQLVSCLLVRYSAAPPFAGCQMTANGVSRRG